MVRAAYLIVAALALAGCASISRATEYQATFADARNFSTAFEMEISIHPRDNTLLFNPRTTLAGPLVTPPEPGEHLIRQIGVEFLGDTGCELGAIRQMARPWFEAAFTCPSGFDIRTEAAAQREQLRQGAPLHR